MLPWSIDNQYPRIASDVVYVFNDGYRLSVGSELNFLKSFAARLGYVFGSDSYNFTAGIGFDYSAFTVSYAYVPFKYDLGTSHRFSVNIVFK